MTEGSLETETLSPLLLELARALRARQFYPATHPVWQDTLERTSTIWLEGLAGVEELLIELRNGSFMLPDGTPLRGPGIDEVAKSLRLRRVRRLRIHRDLKPQELLALIEVLAQTPEHLEELEGLEQALVRAGVRHITTTEIEFAEHFARVRDRAESEDDEDRRVDLDVEDDSTVAAPPPPEPIPPAVYPSPERLRSEAISELIKLLADFEKCDGLDEYREIAQQIRERVTAMAEAGNVTDGYRAVLVCGRHATDGTRRRELRSQAEEWLRQLVELPRMLDLVIDHACSGAGLSSVQATQTLISLGASVVPSLLAHYEAGNSVVQSQITGVLIAMGEAAFPVIVQELEVDSPDRARRAIRLLGRMQNPNAAPALLQKLAEPDDEFQRDAARALARIGTDQAVQGLLRAAQELPELISVVTTCLGETRSPAAVRALGHILDPQQRHPEHEQREAIRSLGRIRNPEALGTLKQVLERRTFFRRMRTRRLRIAAARAIGRIGGEEASRLLAQHAEENDEPVQTACRESLERMSRAGSR